MILHVFIHLLQDGNFREFIYFSPLSPGQKTQVSQDPWPFPKQASVSLILVYFMRFLGCR